MKEQQQTETDLTALNRFTSKELREHDVFTFSAKFIDDERTSNGRVWSNEWMKAAVERKLFLGTPFLANHENDQTLKIGTVYSAELREDGIHGKVFIPLDEQGQQAKEAIENGRVRNVSINADAKIQKDSEITRILPSDDMRVYEVSAVPVGGCKTCTITEEHECLESDKQNSSDGSRLSAFAEHAFASLTHEYVRLMAFTVGTNIDRELYQSIAESVDPLSLQALVNDLNEAYAKGQKESMQETEPTDDASAKIKQEIAQIHKWKGV